MTILMFLFTREVLEKDDRSFQESLISGIVVMHLVRLHRAVLKPCLSSLIVVSGVPN